MVAASIERRLELVEQCPDTLRDLSRCDIARPPIGCLDCTFIVAGRGMSSQHFLNPNDVIPAAVGDHIRVKHEQILGRHPDPLPHVVMVSDENADCLRHLAELPAPVLLPHGNA